MYKMLHKKGKTWLKSVFHAIIISENCEKGAKGDSPMPDIDGEKGRMKMSIVKVIEIIAESNVSWEDAAKNAIKEASKTVEQIKHINIENLSAVVEANEIVKYRLNAKISFVIKG
jgi:hypothetical protein